LLSACQQKASQPSDTSQPLAGQSDDADQDQLRELEEPSEDDIDCEGEGEGEEYGGIPGAGTYFRGHYTREEGGFRGEEVWTLFANDAWQEAGGSNCMVVYEATAEEIEPISCEDCILGLSVVLTVNTAQSDCPRELSDNTDGSTAYSVAEDSGGRSHWYFSSTGELFATGFYSDDGLNFITEPTCKWF